MKLRVPEGKEFLIHGHLYKAGEEFDAPDKEGQLWKATGLANEVADDIPRWLDRKSTKAEKKKTETKEEMPAARYDRKDMRAED
jgi:hypothetical protein